MRSREAEEQRPRPSSSGDLSRDFRERPVTLSPETKSLFEDAHLMADAAPFTHQHRTTLHDARRCCGHSRPVSTIIGELFQQASGRGLETAESLFLEAICDRAHQERPADIARRRLAEHGFPTFADLINIQLRQARDFRCERLAADRSCPSLHDRFSRYFVTFKSAFQAHMWSSLRRAIRRPTTHTLLDSRHGATRAAEG